MKPERLEEIRATLQSDVFFSESESRRVIGELVAEIDNLQNHLVLARTLHEVRIAEMEARVAATELLVSRLEKAVGL